MVVSPPPRPHLPPAASARHLGDAPRSPPAPRGRTGGAERSGPAPDTAPPGAGPPRPPVPAFPGWVLRCSTPRMAGPRWAQAGVTVFSSKRKFPQPRQSLSPGTQLFPAAGLRVRPSRLPRFPCQKVPKQGLQHHE